MKTESPSKQLDGFLSKYTPEMKKQAKAVLAKMRKMFPNAIELVYDNYNALVSGFGPSERASEAILSIAVFPRWVALCFLQGANLPDPDRLLKGSGTQVRHMRLEGPKTLDDPKVRQLLDTAVRSAGRPLDKKTSHRIVIKSISGKQRPRRPE